MSSEDLAKLQNKTSFCAGNGVALPIIGGNEDHLKWIDDEVKES
ncbi:MAG: hypothetical protein NTW48_00580 [Chloroflexi bacterium]|nr:hypothetical protein [Chloroflexota bacterium]